MKSQYEDTIEIDLKELLFAILKKWKRILFFSILIAAITAAVNVFMLPPQYSSTAKLYVFPKGNSTSGYTDVQLGISLTQDYMEVITGKSLVEQVIENLNLSMEYEDLEKDLTIENKEDTRVVEITVVNEDPKMAKKIADEFAEISVDYISSKMKQDPPTILEEGNFSDKPDGPQVIRNTCIGFCIGLLLMITLVSISYFLNNTLDDAETIERYLGLNNLAEIPDSKSMRKSKGRKNRRRKK